MPSCKQEQYKHERISQLANHKCHTDSRPLCSHQLQPFRSPSYITLGWAPPHAGLASQGQHWFTMPADRNGTAAWQQHLSPIKTVPCGFWHSNPEKQFFHWKKNQHWDFFLKPPAVFFQERRGQDRQDRAGQPLSWGQENAGVNLV